MNYEKGTNATNQGDIQNSQEILGSNKEFNSNSFNKDFDNTGEHIKDNRFISNENPNQQPKNMNDMPSVNRQTSGFPHRY
jgi:hypothetical protein